MLTDVDAAALTRLLDLQDEDTAVRRLQSRKSSLPEAQRLAEVADQLAELAADLAIATKQSTELATEQSRIEGEISLTDAKIAREEQRLFSGAVANPKELSALQAEVAMLKRRRAGLEDELLEVMVQSEGATETRERLEREHAELDATARQLRATVDELTGDIEAQLAEHSSLRDTIASELPDDLLELYERVRAQKGGVGAARLENGTCQGCHTKLPAKEVEHLRASGGVQRCDNCRRILVVG